MDEPARHLMFALLDVAEQATLGEVHYDNDEEYRAAVDRLSAAGLAAVQVSVVNDRIRVDTSQVISGMTLLFLELLAQVREAGQQDMADLLARTREWAENYSSPEQSS